MIGKLGKLAPKIDNRTLKLARYFIAGLPDPPAAFDNTGGRVVWGMMANDRLGDCTIAGVGHATQSLAGYTPSDDVVVDYYGLWDGYVEGDKSTDQGGIEIDVLNRWRKEGFNGHKLLAYADPDPLNVKHIKQAIKYFGGVYIGLQLPLSAQDQDVWDVVAGWKGRPGSWGGHAVWCPSYAEDGLFCVTWGELKQMTWAFWEKCCDEAHCLLVPEWGTSWAKYDGVLATATLQSDLELVTG